MFLIHSEIIAGRSCGFDSCNGSTSTIYNDLSTYEELCLILCKYGNNPDGIPALHYAIKKKDEKAVLCLLNNGADPNAIASQGVDHICNTAIEFAAGYGNRSIVKILIQYGAIVDSWQDNFSSNKPLHVAAIHDNPDTIKALIEYGADVNWEVMGGMPIHIAARSHSIKALRALIEMGANVNANSSWGTPLHYAIMAYKDVNKTRKTVQFLLDNNANPNAPFMGEWHMGRTPLFLVRDSLTVLLLSNYGANVNSRDCQGDTPLQYITNGAWGCSHDGESPTWYLDVIKALIVCGADVNAKNNHGLTPLNSCSNEGIRQLLISNGARP